MELVVKICPNAAALLNGVTALHLSWNEGRHLYAAVHQEESQHNILASWRHALSVVAPLKKRNARFLKRRGAIKESRGVMTSANAKKLKFHLIRSKLAEDYK